ncbi:hypothetical protein ACFOLL_01085 [Falsochrobactrum ovis]|uniref:Formate dehydrogenase F4B subunit n=1 Tax=Falsochrobactrum ovis TaxID=1293442 RepID=A0A364JUL2_9HYPH|nr:hypothetical protein [Falsochrobactrum ovis]RAK28187.1 formate dehydrogenase F4B subunit [Falsochrobactrum ovis]
MSEAEFLAFVDRIEKGSDRISRLGAGIIAALQLGIASDSRSFARLLGVAHALVLREVSILGQDEGFIIIERRETRTQRVHYSLSPNGVKLFDNFGF